MRKSRFTDEQMLAILREADRDPDRGGRQAGRLRFPTSYVRFSTRVSSLAGITGKADDCGELHGP